MKLFVFDNFGVVMNELSFIWQSRHLNSDEELNRRGEIGHEADEGKISMGEMFHKYGEMINESGNQVEDEWRNTVQVDWGVIEIVRQLRAQGEKVVMFSNASSEMLRDYLANLGILDDFETVFISSEMSCAKPDPESYLYVCREMGVEPSEALMIDDRELNIKGAEAVGMNAIHFTDAESLKKRLIDESLLKI